MKMNLRAIYDQFAAAWAQGDIEGCLALMTVDARYGVRSALSRGGLSRELALFAQGSRR